MTYFVSGRS